MEITVAQKIKVLGFAAFLGLGLIACGGGGGGGTTTSSSTTSSSTTSSGTGCAANTSTTCNGTVGTAFTGTINPVGDEDWIRYVPSTSGTASFTTSGTTDTVCAIRNSAGTVLASDDDSGSGTNCLVSGVSVTAGATYYGSIYEFGNNSTGSYSALFSVGGGGSSTGSLRLNNTSSFSIDRVNVRRTGTTTWSVDQLTSVLSPGGNWTLTGITPCNVTWDYRAYAVGSSTVGWTASGFTIPCGGTHTRTLTN